MPAERAPATGSVTTQDRKMFRNSPHRTDRHDCKERLSCLLWLSQSRFELDQGAGE